VPDSRRVLEPGMVIALEPGAYLVDGGFGLRLEQVAVVTESGPRVLSAHSLTLAG
jgi:Xaa-Pro aminopeptidase